MSATGSGSGPRWLPPDYREAMGPPVAVAAIGNPAPALGSLVRRYHGSRFAGFAPGVHRGMPSHDLEFIICLDQPLKIIPADAADPRSHSGLVAGLQHRPVQIGHDGSLRNVSLELTPAGARSLLGVPAAELAGQVVDLEAILGRLAAELTDRLAGAGDWASCCAVLDQVLLALVARQPVGPVDHRLHQAWDRIVDTGGRVRVDDLAAEVGYGRHQLRSLFRREYGLSPKQASRIVRFERSCAIVQDVERVRARSPRAGTPTLAEIAVRCGYYDQSHLARDWVDLAGCPPSKWLITEELPFVQDGDGDFGPES